MTGVSASYLYDPFGRREQKTVGAAITKYGYDGTSIIEEYDNAGTRTARYVYGPGIDEPITMDRGANRYFYHFDGSGSVIALTGTCGVISERYTYSPYGESSSTSATGNPYRYTGRELDAETGLYYYRARFYSPSLGRFLQPDAIGYADNLNLYAYVGNDPLNLRDPTGLWGFGLTVSGSIEAGVIVGGGATASAGGGIFGGGPQGLNVGGFKSAGGFAGVAGKGASYPASLPGGTTGVAGAYLGVGGGGFITNAKSAEDLKGPFNTYSINTPIGSIQYGKSGSTEILSVTCGIPPCGVGVGGEVSTYPTNTWVAPDSSLGDPTSSIQAALTNSGSGPNYSSFPRKWK